MKKVLIVLALGAFLTVLISSCSKEEDLPEPNPVSQSSTSNEPYPYKPSLQPK